MKTGITYFLGKLLCGVLAALLIHSASTDLFAQNWESMNIGVPADGVRAGVPAVVSPVMNLQGGGRQIGGVADSFHFLTSQQLMGGNMEVEVRVDLSSFQGPSGALGGLMLRESSQEEAAFAALTVNARGEVFFKWRSSAGAVASQSLGDVPGGQTHCRLKLKRDGYFVAGYQSADGVNWQLVGSAVYGLTPASLSAPLLTGLCVCSQEPSVLAQVAFDSFQAIPCVPQRVVVGAVTSTMKLWLRSDWNVVYDAGGRVSFWEDQSGYANDAVSSAGASPSNDNRPQLVFDAIGGRPAMKFANQGLPGIAARKFMSVTNHQTLSAQGLSVFVVARWPQAQVPLNAALVSKSTADTNGYFLGFQSGVSRFRVMSASRTWASPLVPPSFNQPHLISGEFRNAASLSLLFDGSNPASTTLATSETLLPNTAALYVGQHVASTAASPPASAIHPFTGEIAEIIMYQNSPANAGMALETRREMEAYFRARYGIQAMTLPAAPSPTILLGGRTGDGGIFTGTESGLVNLVIPAGSWVYYSINGGPRTLYSGPFTPSTRGAVSIKAWAEKPGHDTSPEVIRSFFIDEETKQVARTELKLWLRADRGVTLASGKVMSWKSQAPDTVYEAVENVVARMPSFTASSSHGRSAILFPDAANTCLKIAAAGSPPHLNSYTLFVAGRQSAGAAMGMGRVISRTSGDSNGYYFGVQKSSSGSALVAWQSRMAMAGGIGMGQSSTTSPTRYLSASPAWNLLSARGSTTDRWLRINGFELQSAHSPGAPLSADSTADLWLGSHAGTSEFFRGEIAEILLYGRTLTAGEVREVEAYLAGRYAPDLRPVLNLTAIATGTYPGPMNAVFATGDAAEIHYRMDAGDGNGWSQWQARTGDVSVSVGKNMPVPQTYQFEVWAAKEGFQSSYTEANPLRRTLRIDPGTADVSREGLKLWLRAGADLQQFTLSNDLGVVGWEDQSGAQNHLVADLGSRPTFVPASDQEPAAVRFEGEAAMGRLKPADPAFRLGALPDNDLMVIAVIRDEGTSGLGTLFELSNATATSAASAGFLLQLDHATSSSRLRSQMLHESTAALSAVTPYSLGNGYHLLTQRIKHTPGGAPVKTHQVSVDRAYGGENAATVTANSSALDFALGARRSSSSVSAPFKGRLVELLIYDKPLPVAEMNRLEASLVERYSLPVADKPDLPMVSAQPGSGIWPPQQRFTLSHAEPGVTIRYRHYVQGEDAGDWLTYDDPFPISSTGEVILETRAEKAGFDASAVRRFNFRIEPSVSRLPREKLAVWLRADQGVSSNPVGGDLRVTSWMDQSGNGHVAQSPAVLQPRWLKSTAFRSDPARAVDVINFTRSAVSPVNYTGSEGPRLVMPSPASMNGGTLTAFVVSRSLGWPKNDANEGTLLKRSGAASGWMLGYRDRPAGVTTDSENYRGIQLTVVSGGVPVVLHAMVAPASNNSIFSRPTLTTANVHDAQPLRVMPNASGNGELRMAYNFAADFTGQTDSILMGSQPGGDDSFLHSEVAEVLLYDAQLNEEEMARVQDYLIGRYDFVYQKPLAAPTISPNGGIFNEPQVVTVTAPEGAVLNCSVNGVPVQADGSVATVTVAPPSGAGDQAFRAEIVASCSKPGYVNSPESRVDVVIDPAAEQIPPDLKAKIRLWLRADAGVRTSLLGGMQVVRQWDDLSGYGHHLTQAIPGTVPAVRSHPTVVLLQPGFNGKPALRFENVPSAKTYLKGSHPGLNGPRSSVFAVLKRSARTITGESVIAEKYDVAGPRGFSLRMTNAALTTPFKFLTTSGQSTYTVQPLGGGLDQGVQFVGGVQDATQRRLYLQGNAVAADAAGTPIVDVSSSFYLGSNLTPALFLDADVAELWVFNDGLSQVEVDRLSRYVHQRYALMSSRKLAVPVPSLRGGIYSAAMQVQLTSPVPGARVVYQLGAAGQDASSVLDPDTNSPEVPSFLTLQEGGSVLKARAVKPGFIDSDVGTWTYRIEPGASFVRKGLAVWLRADCDVITDVGGRVNAWKDQSGNANDAVAPAPAIPDHRPSLFGLYGAGLHGHSVVEFNKPGGTLPVRLTVPHNATIDSGTMSFFAVARKTGANNGILIKKGGGILRMGGTAAAPTGIMSTNGAVTPVVPIIADQFQLLSGTHDGAWRRVSNGAIMQEAASAIQLTRDTLPLFIGTNATTASTSAFQGQIVELLVYNRGLSSAERLEVEGYLRRRYSDLGMPAPEPPVFAPLQMNASSGGTYYAARPGEVALFSPGGLPIFWSTRPDLADSQEYTRPIPVHYTTRIYAACRLNGRSSPVVVGTFYLDPSRYPAPGTGPPNITLEKPTTASPVSNP